MTSTKKLLIIFNFSNIISNNIIDHLNDKVRFFRKVTNTSFLHSSKCKKKENQDNFLVLKNIN